MTTPRAALKTLVPPIIVQGMRKLSAHSRRSPAGDRPGAPLPPFVSGDLGSYAQYAEDMVVDAVLGCPARGFYIDVGANDPSLLNNTRRFYDRGWHGITIEPDPRMHARLVANRPRDVTLNLGAASTDGTCSFYRLDPDTLSTFDPAERERTVRENPRARLLEVLEVEVATLDSICRSHLQPEQTIDFLSVDVEGTELAVLKGNDWRRTRPAVVLSEINRAGTEIVEFMTSVDYDYLWCNGTNALFRARALDDADVSPK